MAQPTKLGNIPLFAGLDQQAIAIIEAGVKIRKYPKGAIIVTQGDESNAMYIVLEGRLKVYRTHSSGKETVLGILGTGDFFGELALLAPAPRSASVIVQEPAELAILSNDHVFHCLDKHPELARNMLVSLAEMFRERIAWLSDLAVLDVYGRVTRFLLKHSYQEGDDFLSEPITQEEIAQHVGTSREMISRIFKELRIGGYISMRGRQIVIHKRLPEHW